MSSLRVGAILEIMLYQLTTRRRKLDVARKGFTTGSECDVLSQLCIQTLEWWQMSVSEIWLTQPENMLKFVQFGTRATKSVLNICIIKQILTQMNWRKEAHFWNSSTGFHLDTKAKFLSCNKAPQSQQTWASESPGQSTRQIQQVKAQGSSRVFAGCISSGQCRAKAATCFQIWTASVSLRDINSCIYSAG